MGVVLMGFFGIIMRYVYNKVGWQFSIYKLGETWVKLKVSLPSYIYACCQLSTRNILETSQNLEIQELC